MTLRTGLRLGLFKLLTLVLLIPSTHANPTATNLATTVSLTTEFRCEQALAEIQPRTLGKFRELSTAALHKSMLIQPQREFNDLVKETHNEQRGVSGPLALQQMAGSLDFVRLPTPSAAMDTSVNMRQQAGKAIALTKEIEWHGGPAATTVYASLPKTIKPHSGPYLVGKEYAVVVVHLHGGGTNLAKGANGLGIADDFPLLAFDLPGHGQATTRLDGLTTIDGQVDWILTMIEQLVDPSVQIVLTGHSWGAEFAIYMHRHSHEPRYARFAHFFAISPPVDVTLGSGDKSKNLELDQYLEAHLHELKDRIAPEDFEFQSNIYVHGKLSRIGGEHASVTQNGFSTPPLTAEEQQKLKPISVIVGAGDGLVYVGREAQFQAAYGGLTSPSEFIVLGPAKNWKSGDSDILHLTGHTNIWDRQNQSGKPDIYTRISDKVHSLMSPSEGEDVADPAEVRMSETFRNYSEHFIFRQMIEQGPEYVKSTTEEGLAAIKRQTGVDELKGAPKGGGEEGRKRQAEFAARLALTYVPPNEPDIAELVGEMNKISIELEKVLKGSENVGKKPPAPSPAEMMQKWQEGKSGLKNLEKLLRMDQNEVANLLRRWEVQWKSGVLSSPLLRAANAKIQEKLDVYAEAYRLFEHSKALERESFTRQGQPTAEAMLKFSPELQGLSVAEQKAKAQLEASQRDIESLRWQEALAGHIEGPAENVNEVSTIAHKLWGDSYTEPSATSLVTELRKMDTDVESLRRQESVLRQQFKHLQWIYSEAMLQRGYAVPEMHQVSIKDALALPYTELVARLRRDSVLMSALKGLLEEASVYIGQLRVEAQSKSVGTN